jgi:hypothetical protein
MFIDYLPAHLRYRTARMLSFLGIRSKAVEWYLTVWDPKRERIENPEDFISFASSPDPRRGKAKDASVTVVDKAFAEHFRKR